MAVIKAKINDKWEKVALAKQVPMIVEPMVLTGDQSKQFLSEWAYRYMKYHGDSITTENITNASRMFYNYKGETIPFEINCVDESMSLYGVFTNSNIREAPKINVTYVENYSYLFSNCYYLKTIPDDYFDNWDTWLAQTWLQGQQNNMFSGCYSLRYIPESWLRRMRALGMKENSSNATYNPYNSAFSYCYSLDEIKNLGVSRLNSHCDELTVINGFKNTFYQCGRLKSLTFEPVGKNVAIWAANTIDLSTCGYIVSGSPEEAIKKYAGFTDDTRVEDDATYQALKDNPDYWTTSYKYSRYNHDSAVETINSLPETNKHHYLVSGQPENIIKFKGASGELTDGGAINTLTPEEIAVATAKDWTIALV